jgi:hypothetical protein
MRAILMIGAMRHMSRTLLTLLVLISFFAFTTTATANPAYRHVMSSGLFLLPGDAQSMDWAVINNSKTDQTFRVTIYKGNLGALKTAVAPGSLEFTLKPGFTSHNANSVGAPPLPFQIGFYYEVVVETNSLDVLPTVTVWKDRAARMIPGTTILPGNFVEINKR